MSAKKTPASKKATRMTLLPKDTIKFEKDIPPPEYQYAKAMYPLDDLGIGESFSYSIIRGAKERQLRSANSAINHYRSARPNCKRQFVARIIDAEGVIRVWRIADSK